MNELRWNPLLGTYTMVAANRQNRPNLPTDFCPFCPGSDKVPKNYSVFVYDNDFPALSDNPPMPNVEDNNFYHAAPAHGKCEVILYSPEHDRELCHLSLKQVTELVAVWTERFRVHSSNPYVRYVFPFENKGEEVGVTIHHPHGQLYAYPFVPLRVKTKLENSRRFFEETGQCLFCKILKTEQTTVSRMIYENDSFAAFVPWFSEYPYGVFILSKNHLGNLTDLNGTQAADLARALLAVTGGFNELFSRSFPYMMCIYQNPVNSPEYAGCEAFHHFHIEFFPPLRDARRIKYNASSETGAWAAANTLAVEETAPQLKIAIESYLKNKAL